MALAREIEAGAVLRHVDVRSPSSNDSRVGSVRGGSEAISLADVHQITATQPIGMRVGYDGNDDEEKEAYLVGKSVIELGAGCAGLPGIALALRHHMAVKPQTLNP